MSFIDITFAEDSEAVGDLPATMSAATRFEICFECNKFQDKTTEDTKHRCVEANLDLHTIIIFKHTKCPLEKW